MINRNYHPQKQLPSSIKFSYFLLLVAFIVLGIVITILRPIPTNDSPLQIFDISCLTEEQLSEINQTSEINSLILEGAKYRTNFDVTYTDKYYSTNDGRPPEGEGVCTDLFWRAMEKANIEIVKLVNDDIANNPSDYPLNSWTGVPDKYIDYRRVPNLEAYFKKYWTILPTNIEECDLESIIEWKPGDVVIFNLDGVGPNDHIAIVSDNRDRNGIPHLIHNWGLGEKESSGEFWFERAVGHYRIKGF